MSYRTRRPDSVSCSPAKNTSRLRAARAGPYSSSWHRCISSIATSSSSHWRCIIPRSRMFWYAPQTVIAGGTTSTETISEYAIVIAAVMLNCWDAVKVTGAGHAAAMVNGTGSYSDTSNCSDVLAREQNKIKRGGSVETDTVLFV